MSSQTADILCGRCKVVVKGPAEPGPNDMVTCPRCGRSDTFKSALKSAGEFLEDSVGEALFKDIKSSFRGVSGVQVSQCPRPHRSYRFIPGPKK